MLIGDRYRVIERLGTGGMATVLLAEDERLGRRVALKRLHVGFAPEMEARFTREAKLGASLSHPNVVGVYDVVNHEDEVVLVMEYVDGPTLDEVLAGGPMSPDKAIALLRPLADALDHAHKQGVVHRDVKPANVLVRQDGTVKLADLGIATGVELTSVTATGTALGSAAYMAPEQFEGLRATAAADVYALAAVAFEMLSGRKARTGNTPMEVVHRIATEGAPSLRDAWPEAPARTVDVLGAALATDPEARPQSAGDLVAQLEESLDLAAPAARDVPVAAPTPAPTTEMPRTPETGPAVTAPLTRTATTDTPVAAASPPRRDRRGRGAAVAAVLAVALLAVGGTLLALRGTDDEPSPRAPERAERAPTRKAPKVAAPARVARAFYERAARDRFESAWRLAGPGFRQQLGGYAAFRSQFGTLESIRFDRAETTSESGNQATVAVSTRATHTDRVDTCSGDVSLRRSARSKPWLIERIGVDCAS